MISLRLHRERFQAQQASARSTWFVTSEQGSLGRGLATIPGGYAPCGLVTKPAKNLGVDR